jgi:hypothetical protein
MTEEDEAFNEIERRSVAKKEAVRAVINKEKPMNNTLAFPNPNRTDQTGMTLRDYFAAKSITSVMATPWFQHTSSVRGSCEYADELAGECYAIADAMLKAMET